MPFSCAARSACFSVDACRADIAQRWRRRCYQHGAYAASAVPMSHATRASRQFFACFPRSARLQRYFFVAIIIYIFATITRHADAIITYDYSFVLSVHAHRHFPCRRRHAAAHKPPWLGVSHALAATLTARQQFSFVFCPPALPIRAAPQPLAMRQHARRRMPDED